ncbi:MAG: hypothetical protein Q9195_004162 [Heterodermia aff. obscurata]
MLSAPKLANLPFWTTTLTVNGQKVTMMIDTGSADLYALLRSRYSGTLTQYESWLHGSKAPPAKGGPGAKLVPGESFSIAYGGSSNVQEGNGVATTVHIGDLSVSNYVVGTVIHDVYKNELRLDGRWDYLDGWESEAWAEYEFWCAIQYAVNFQFLQYPLSDDKVLILWTVDTGGGDTMLADGKFVVVFWQQVADSKKLGGNYVLPCSSKPPDMKISIESAGEVTIPGSSFKRPDVGSGQSIFMLR